MKRKRIVLLTTFLIVMACLVVGYAALQTTLNITGNSNVKGNSWDVHWANIQVTSGSTTDVITPATITTPTKVEFNINLNAPGDYYEFKVDAVNAGTIDAMIDTIDFKVLNGLDEEIEIPSYLEYDITYEDGIEIVPNQLLAANSTETYKARVEYKRNITADELVTTDTSIKFVLEIPYTQSVEGYANPVRTTLFSYPEGQDYSLLNDMTEFPNTYETMEEVISATGQPFFIKGIITQGEVSSIEVGLKYNENIYYFKGGINEQGLTEKPTFENNISIAQNFFGSSNCSLTQGTTTNYYFCNSQSKHLSATLTDSGMVTIGSEDNPFNRCRINNNTSNDYYIRCGAWAD